jgi:hypothetical protein
MYAIGRAAPGKSVNQKSELRYQKSEIAVPPLQDEKNGRSGQFKETRPAAENA